MVIVESGYNRTTKRSSISGSNELSFLENTSSRETCKINPGDSYSCMFLKNSDSLLKLDKKEGARSEDRGRDKKKGQVALRRFVYPSANIDPCKRVTLEIIASVSPFLPRFFIQPSSPKVPTDPFFSVSTKMYPISINKRTVPVQSVFRVTRSLLPPGRTQGKEC